tara:strand:- start:128 stop:937 length:810 start_codon:yes stop_codon:yes gene_type:complete
MKIIRSKNKLKSLINNEKSLGFVPTMGAIHKGHISLVKKSKLECKKTVVSIFINKPQFNVKSDFNKYPRKLAKDIKILKKIKVDFLYLPSNKQIYPNGPNRNIKISTFAKKLCGVSRPGHFKAVVDVIDRFIKILNPRKIYFGEKDMQQLMIIKTFVRKNHKKVIVVPCKTIREKNGIASSSRNILLTLSEKKIASKIYKTIKRKKNYLIKKKSVIRKIKFKIKNLGVKKIDYIEIININKIIQPYKKNNKYKIFIAYYLNKTRLIDNI